MPLPAALDQLQELVRLNQCFFLSLGDPFPAPLGEIRLFSNPLFFIHGELQEVSQGDQIMFHRPGVCCLAVQPPNSSTFQTPALKP